MLGDGFVDAATFAPASGSLIEVMLAFSALANAALFALNIIPAFPLDGGRIARAAAWKLSGDRHKATKFSAYMGQGFAVLMIGYGVYVLAAGGDPISGLWWIVLGWMLGGAARAAVAQSAVLTRLEGITAGDIMDSEPVVIPAAISVERAYDEFFLRYQGWEWFAVVEDDGHFAGLAHRAAVEHAALRRTAAARPRGRRRLRARPDRHAAGIAAEQRAAAHDRRADGRRRRGPAARRGDVRPGSRALQARLAPS